MANRSAGAVRILIATAVAVVLVAVTAGTGTTSATSFNPQFTASLSDSTPGAPADLTIDFSIPSPDANFDVVVTFLPPEFDLSSVDDVPVGAIAGSLDANSTLGLFNNACNNNILVSFVLINALADPNGPIGDPYSGFEDWDGDGLPENVENYPQFLTIIAPGVEPVARLYGGQIVAGDRVFINIVIFEPGERIAQMPELDPALGYPMIAWLDDPTQPARLGALTDFCTPLGTITTSLGVSEDNPETAASEGGYIIRRNPDSDGAFSMSSFIRSRWDADNDGIESLLDPCPFTLDPGWNPRALSTVDGDQDGLPPSCDPNDGVFNTDVDGDQFQNRHDNCPLVYSYAQSDYDNDGIGDVCDPYPQDPSNNGSAHRHDVCRSAVLYIGAGGPDPGQADCPDGPDLPTPLELILWPEEETRGIGRTQTLGTAVFDPLSWDFLNTEPIDFAVAGAHEVTGSCVPTEFAECEFSYTGTNPGTDTVTATVEIEGQLLEATSTIHWVVAPGHDDLAAAEEVPQIPYETTTTIAGSESEDDEPGRCRIAETTVWYRYTPGSDGYVMASGWATNDLVALGAFEGPSLSQLEPKACSYFVFPESPIEIDGFPLEVESRLFFGVEAGVTYYIQVSASLESGDPEISLAFDEAVHGDVDCSGAFDAADVLAVLYLYAGLDYGDTGYAPCIGAADFECVGIDLHDAWLMLGALSGIEMATPDCDDDWGDY